MDNSVLKDAGLTNGEAKVYISLLELGSCSTGPIMEKSGIARSIIYHILEKLIEKGLVSYIIKEKTKYFQASSPKKLLEYMEETKSKIEENKQKIENALPQLLLLQKMSPKTSVQVFEGFRGIQAVQEHTYERLSRGEEYKSFGIFPQQTTTFHTYWQRDHLRRIKAGIKVRMIFNKGTDKKILENRNSYKGCDARYMVSDLKTPAWIMTYKDVSVIVLQDPKQLAVEIINQEIADTFKQYFEDYWKDTVPFRRKK